MMGSIALLDLPACTALSLDGSATQTLRNAEDLIAVKDVPHGFHLLSFRASRETVATAGGTPDDSRSNSILHCVGMVVLFDTDKSEEIKVGGRCIARRYDKKTEEISCDPLDPITARNLENAIQRNNEGSGGGGLNVIPYSQFMGIHSYAKISSWKEQLTNFISIHVLQRHSLTGQGDKIIPGSYSADDIARGESSTKKTGCSDIHDGIVMDYAPIPCIDMEVYGHNSVRNGRSNGKTVDTTRTGINSHHGTRRYLASLSPSKRTALFTSYGYDHGNGQVSSHSQTQGDAVFTNILRDSYGNRWEVLLGELQLSFVVFLSCSCLASLEHWRDTVCMLSLVHANVIAATASSSNLYRHFLVTLTAQLSNFDCGVFHEEEFAQGNIFVPAIRRIVCQCKRTSCTPSLHQDADNLLQVLFERFEVQGQNFDDESAAFNESMDHDASKMEGWDECGSNRSDGDDNEDEDGPAIVPLDEVKASMERSACLHQRKLRSPTTLIDENQYLNKESYPFLFAAMCAEEDILMTCARILDEQTDVTLVREAADYLEQVEATRSGT